jgi:phosphocarrier protein FPr
MVMDVLSASAVVTGAHASDSHAAIELVGGLLVAEGCATPGYVAAMHDREAIVSTYLGNGIALPHGTNEAKDEVIRTGLAVAQFPDGIPWGEEDAHLVIGLAATSGDHLNVLSKLAAILGDEALCRRLGTTADAAEIHRTLITPSPDEEDGHGEPAQADEIAVVVRVTNPAGLHARPATNVVDQLRPLDAEIAIEANGRRANARSITALLGLGAAVGGDVRVVARGSDAKRAVDAVVTILTTEEG